jgi:hypothetical protein
MTALATNLVPVRVRVRQLDYLTRGTNPLGDEVDRMATAYGPGDSRLDPSLRTDLDPQSHVGLITSGAVRDITTDDTGEEVEQEEELLDAVTASSDQLADWIREERPTVQDVVSASGGDVDVARKLLEAEAQAQSGEARKGVVEGLTAVISRG